MTNVRRSIPLEINIPFCLRACEHCVREVITGWNSERLRSYLKALMTELAANANQFADCEISAVHLGGGTASLVRGEDLVALLRLVRSHYRVAEHAPVSMLSSISSFSGASMPLYKRAGITRFDLEVMSLDPAQFSHYNKTDALGDFAVVCDYFLRTYANNNLGLVLVRERENQTNAKGSRKNLSLRRSINTALSTHAVHLVLQPGAESSRTGELRASDASDASDASYAEARELLCKGGFVEYAPHYFAKPGFEDAALSARVCQKEVLGFGLGAQTRFDGIVSTNTSTLDCYLRNAADFSKITAEIVPQ